MERIIPSLAVGKRGTYTFIRPPILGSSAHISCCCELWLRRLHETNVSKYYSLLFRLQANFECLQKSDRILNFCEILLQFKKIVNQNINITDSTNHPV